MTVAASEAQRLRLDDTRMADSHTRAEQAPDGCTAILVCQTTKVTTYPTSAKAYYAVQAQLVGGTETEGSAGSYSSDGTSVFYALNLGSVIPPQGTIVVCYYVDYRWVFRYDG
ncbi:MAG: hypothetical protein P4L84_34965 [Isosphaeraceae bacterium]|nr:hypothetical protein [Isosphaeraceae bacterium]